MPPLEHLAILAGVVWALVCAALALREAALDFAEQRFADEFGGDRSYGDWVNVPDDLKSTVFHEGRK